MSFSQLSLQPLRNALRKRPSVMKTVCRGTPIRRLETGQPTPRQRSSHILEKRMSSLSSRGKGMMRQHPASANTPQVATYFPRHCIRLRRRRVRSRRRSTASIESDLALKIKKPFRHKQRPKSRLMTPLASAELSNVNVSRQRTSVAFLSRLV